MDLGRDPIIVVGLDGSDGSLAALRWASALACNAGARVQPVMAWEYPALSLLPYPAGLPVPPAEAMSADTLARATGILESIDLPDDVEVNEPLVVRGRASNVLCQAVEPSDLLVIGSRGLGFVRGVLLGSVSVHCATAAPCPVAIVPDPGAGSPGEALKVVVGVDGSPTSSDAVAWADQWAPPEAELLLAHVWNMPLTMDFAAASFDADVFERGGQELLDRAASLIERHDFQTQLVRGDPRVELERFAAGADMMVIGARGASILERVLIGSVTSHAIHHVGTPTVVVPHSQRES